MTLFVDDPDFRLLVGDVREQLRLLPDACVDCVVTSPPYWGLRDYGEPGQIGLEATPQEYVAVMVDVFTEVWRVLAPHGTVWLNLGDSYAGSNRGNAKSDEAFAKLQGDASKPVGDGGVRPTARQVQSFPAVPFGMKQKDLVGIPWRVAFALQDDGWYLRSDIIWSKPNPMPESVTDRPTKSHEYVFLLSKQPRYYFDQEAVREPWTTDRMPGQRTNETQHYGAGNGGNGGLTAHRQPFMAAMRDARRPQDETLDGSEGEAPRGPDGRRQTGVKAGDGSIQHRDGERWPNGGRNIRSVWEIATQPYAGAHFATFPEELPRRAIKAGCPEWVCATCGKPRERIIERGEVIAAKPAGARLAMNPGTPGMAYENKTVGWSDCGHGDYRPGTVLDPFMGAGTTALVARKLGRHSVGIELNQEYADLARRRLQQLSLFA